MKKNNAQASSSGHGVLLCFSPTQGQKQAVLKSFGVEADPDFDFKDAYEKQKQLLEEQQKLLNALLEKQRQEEQKKAEDEKQRQEKQKKAEAQKKAEEEAMRRAREQQKAEEAQKKAAASPSPEAVKQIIKLEKQKTALQNRMNALKQYNPKTSGFFILFLILAFICMIPFGITDISEDLKVFCGTLVIAFAICALLSPLFVRNAKKNNENQLRMVSEQLERIDEQIQSYKNL